MLENNDKFPLYYYNNLSVSLLKINSIEVHNLSVIPQSTPTVNSNFSLTKNSSHREKIPYICGLRARIEYEPFSEYSTRSDRVTNIGYLLPVGASVLPAANYYLITKFLCYTKSSLQRTEGLKMNVLLVDDERLAVEVMNRMIDKEKYGFSVIYKALSMKQAQKICEEADIDIIICDIEMPRGSGLDFVQWLLDTGRNPIVIFLTSHAVFSYAQQAVSLGVQDYLLKPVEQADMNQALEKAIRKAKNRKKNFLEEEKIRQLDEGVQSADKNVNRVKIYIEAHFKEELTRESLASEVFMNPDYLSKVFKKKTGSSLMDYVAKVRIEKAKKLLERTALSVSEIAMETGYSNTAYFTKMFKKYTDGVTPREYRKGFGDEDKKEKTIF